MILHFLCENKDVSHDLFYLTLFLSLIIMVHKRSESKLQERKDKSFSKRKKVSGHLNRLEWLLSLPVVFRIF